jgi:hypothetical protein
MGKEQADDHFSDEETARRRDELAKQILNTPPKPLKQKNGADHKMKPATVTSPKKTAQSEFYLDLLGKSINGFLGFLSGANQLVRVEPDVTPATGTFDPLIRFEPSDSLSHFVAALRAIEFDRLIVK